MTRFTEPLLLGLCFGTFCYAVKHYVVKLRYQFRIAEEHDLLDTE